MNFFRKLILLALLLCYQHVLFAQYILNGSAQKNSCNCYTLTQPTTFQSGSVWNSNKISLTNSFDFWFNVFLGCDDVGADGMVFILQPLSTSVGSSGQGMGFEGVKPSIGIALDTYLNSNLNDPSFDHISIQANGVIDHNNDLAGPVPISSTTNNVEDCQWHKLRITWDANTKWLRTYFDGVLRLEKQVDLISTIFNNDPNVYWGFAGATGGQVNLQQFCTALDPVFSTNFTNNITCEGSAVTFTNASESFAPISSYNWNFGDGTVSNLMSPPQHFYPTPGDYKVTLKVTGQDGCERDSTKTITVASKPSAALSAFDTCFGSAPRINFTSPNANMKYQWEVDGIAMSGTQTPSFSTLSAGPHQLKVVVSSIYSCGSPAIAEANFIVKPQPVVDFIVQDGCVNDRINLAGLQTDNQTNISDWGWSIENNNYAGQQLQHLFSSPNNYPIRLWATAFNGCSSDTVDKVVKIASANIVAKDTVIIRNLPAQLFAAGNGNFQWTPSMGLSNDAVPNPIATLTSDQVYSITVTTPEGCIATGRMKVSVFDGPTVYVPTAFTPNGDGKNERLLPVYIGITELKQFSVFDRWGKRVFTTTNLDSGWDGGKLAGTFVWLVDAINHLGKRILLKGTVTIIK
ncbi:MAG: PKD domain-containing protein [Chitinophagaceae bacterium]|nr:MAG: PKD domain-containing protein [Chitinophagaceae bacterium]